MSNMQGVAFGAREACALHPYATGVLTLHHNIIGILQQLMVSIFTILINLD